MLKCYKLVYLIEQVFDKRLDVWVTMLTVGIQRRHKSTTLQTYMYIITYRGQKCMREKNTVKNSIPSFPPSEMCVWIQSPLKS
jgi:hypothetical protein